MISVIIPTHNRPDKLADTVACLERQSLATGDYEIIAVDDGSYPPIKLADEAEGPKRRLVRLEGVERSKARNAGATAATGNVLVFIDDDISVGREFLAAHLRAHSNWPDALVVGSVRLPDQAMANPFARFRQNLEQQGLPQSRGVTWMRNFCTAANMSIAKDLFEQLGGFDASISSSEDQDLALRHTTSGGQIVFIPETEAVHCDTALDIRSYCRRAKWGSEKMIPFCERYPDWPDNIERERVNGPVRWGREPVWQSVRKVIKLALALKPVVETLFGVASLLERLAPNSRALDRVYRLLLGAHIFRGYRKGLKRSAISDQRSAIGSQRSAVISQPSAR